MTKRMILPLLFGISGIAVLLWLGFWQLDRLEWKERVLSQISTKMAATPDPLIKHYKSLAPRSQLNYTRVEFEGELTQTEAHVLTSIKFKGPGYRILKEVWWNGKNFLVDLGFVPESQKNAKRPIGTIRVIGNILNPDDYDEKFTPDPDLEKNIWFARFMPMLAQELGVTPFLVVAETVEHLEDGKWVPYAAVTPLPVSVNIPNDHLQYAITWFSLALVWFGMTVYLLWRIKRKTI